MKYLIYKVLHLSLTETPKSVIYAIFYENILNNIKVDVLCKYCEIQGIVPSLRVWYVKWMNHVYLPELDDPSIKTLPVANLIPSCNIRGPISIIHNVRNLALK